MGTEVRDKERNLIRSLRADPTRFDFFEAVRRLEWVHPDKPRMGAGSTPNDDPVRFGQEPSLAFPPTTIADFQEAAASPAARLVVYFFGLLGPNGPMPLQFTEHVRTRSLNNLDPTLQRFLDVFHHRLISLFYRAWALNEQPVSYDRQDDDWFSRDLGRLIGVERCENPDPGEVPFHAKLYWAGRLIGTTHNAEGLEVLLADFFELPARIEQFVGIWIPIPEKFRCFIGGDPGSATLGRNAILGSSSYTNSEKFKVILGPMDLENYERMLPGGNSFSRLRDWVDSYLQKPLLWEVQSIIKAEEIPRTKLGKYGQIGLTSWLKSRPVEEDKGDLVLQSTTKVKRKVA